VSPSGRYQVLYAERGTKGLVLEHGAILREIDRSFYHADAYDYPAALGGCRTDARSWLTAPTPGCSDVV
jgi:hypothetical protein